MDENPPEDFAVSSAAKANRQGWPPNALEEDKKAAFWKGGVMECFSNVLSLFSKTDLTPTKEDDWEVPFSELSDFLYLGSGAQGIVFRSSLRGELVAVKKLRERSEANIKHLRKLNHENIVRFRGVSINGPVPCVVMEYCQYGPLFNFLHSGANITAAQIFNWAKEIAQGMAYLHSNKIIHRDLKSPNILIAEHLSVKVSDFGTAREWDNVSAIMSFTGTVAWMAPEVIRHEPCSERVDVWSYGVVLWELITQEVPYKNLETHAIMWGVGTDTLSLPIPDSCPESLRQLLQQCWGRIPKLRPPFQLIAANLAISGDTFESYDPMSPDFAPSEGTVSKGEAPSVQEVQRKDEIKQVRNVKQIYEQQLNRANDLYMEVCAVRLQLEQREKEVSEREKALETCRCSIRKNLKYAQRQTSSSSENVIVNPMQNERRRKNKEAPTHKNKESQIVVNYVGKGEKTVSVAVAKNDLKNVIKDVTECACADSVENNNISTVKMNGPIKMKETSIKFKDIVEQNGNIIKRAGKKLALNDNYVADVTRL
ncbi:unnamed protein product [Arctia plantaginis]|uniref:Protein kinase domain-containing protein n=1 Tax=Arctia plantaginis TaxID=874455 RepID=A0A8S0Z2D8_ARCPL|nr:unnamed protein product [Arctia plantaginis]